MAGGFSAALLAFTIAAAALVTMLVGGSLALATVSDRTLARLERTGPTVKRWGGTLLLLLAAWFAYMAIATPTYLMR
ncbi:MAG: hypothetical protein MAG471_01847 [Acidimicrobiaceae bacterium]|nr:hypothetical protein [Acidimicrobiaceae bacterium]